MEAFVCPTNKTIAGIAELLTGSERASVDEIRSPLSERRRLRVLAGASPGVVFLTSYRDYNL